MVVGSKRVSLSVTSVADAEVVRSVLARFAKRHGASERRGRALVDLANELCLDLVLEGTGGRIEAERVGSFIEVRAVSRASETAGDATKSPTRELPIHDDDPAPTSSPTPSPEPSAASSSAASSSWRLDLALANMDGAERSSADADQVVLRAWCGLD